MIEGGYRVRVRRGPRAGFPDGDDDAVGAHLFRRVRAALEGGGLPRPALVAVRADSVDQFDLLPLLRLPPPERHRLEAAMAAGLPGTELAALGGTLRVRAGGREGPALVVYVEWPDNRWWTAWQPVGPDRAPLGDGPVVRRAEEGWPKPGGVGAWFSTARRLRLRLELRPVDPAGGSGLVH